MNALREHYQYYPWYNEKKKMETFTFKLNMIENRILFSTAGGATFNYHELSLSYKNVLDS